MISKETIEEILARTDILSLINGYVSLKRAGSRYKGLCPFHSEKTPSFTVYPQDNSFHCFGCGVGGDQISFIRKIENLDYPDAIRFLGKRAGITVVDDNRGAFSNEPRIDKSRIYSLNAEAAKFFHRCLFYDNPESKAALSYFTEKRKMSLSTIKHFGLGYAPDSFDTLLKFMLAKGYTKDELHAADLIGKSERGHYYDAFRKKVMFPIIDVSGNVIAFGGRVLDNSKPKYRNSSDTPVYKKLKNLFALNFAKKHCSEVIILCEGYIDVIALHAVGIENAVATLGTAITSEQARLLSRYTKKVVLSYDSDEAGQKATVRAMKILEDVGLEVGILTIPDAKDPDEYIITYGVDKFKEHLVKPKSKFDYNFDGVLKKYDISLPQDKINALGELEKMVSAVYSVAERDIYIQTIAKRFDVSASGVKADVERIIARNTNAYKRAEQKKMQQISSGYSDKVNPDFIKAPTVARNEETVLGLLLLYPEHRKRVFDEKILLQNDFYTEFNRRVFKFIEQSYNDGDTLFGLSEVFTPEEMGRISRMKINRMQLSSNGPDVLDECIKTLKKSLDKKAAQSTNTIDSLTEILMRKRGCEN